MFLQYSDMVHTDLVSEREACWIHHHHRK